MPKTPTVERVQAIMRLTLLPFQSAKKLNRIFPNIGPQKNALYAILL